MNMEKEEMSSKVNFKVESYKDIKQYIHNYLGLTKEEVKSMLEETLEDIVNKEVRKILNDKPKVTDMINKSIIEEIRRQDNCERHSYTISVMDDIYNKIDKTIHEEVRSKLIVGLRDDYNTEYHYRYGLIEVTSLPDSKTMESLMKYLPYSPVFEIKDTEEKYIYKDRLFIKICESLEW